MSPVGNAVGIGVEDAEAEAASNAPSPLAMSAGVSAASEANFEHVRVLSYIAKGASGSVYKAKYLGMLVAVKQFTLSPDDDEGVEAFHNEITLLRSLNHVNLVRFYAACTTYPNLCIITELMMGSLADLLYGKNAKQLPDEKWHDKRKIVRSERLPSMRSLRLWSHSLVAQHTFC